MPNWECVISGIDEMEWHSFLLQSQDPMNRLRFHAGKEILRKLWKWRMEEK